MKELLYEAKELLTDLKRCGDFHFGAIEIDEYIDNSINGKEFEKKINVLLKKIGKLDYPKKKLIK